MTPRLNWLASYPKSGNTWVRAFLSAMMQRQPDALDLNQLAISAAGFHRSLFDRVLGFETAHLSREHCARLRPRVYRWLNAQLEEPVYCKIHDACSALDNGDWLMAPDVTDKVLYIIRNPLDVAVSTSHFADNSLDKTISKLGCPNERLARQLPTTQKSQVEQILGTWSQHVQSWVGNPLFNTCVVRYEDLQQTPHQSFSQICAFLGIAHTSTQVQDAIDISSFKALQTLEKASGFRERPQTSTQFFRSGKVGDWKAVFSNTQVNKVLDDHLHVMQKFGYANKDGSPRYC